MSVLRPFSPACAALLANPPETGRGRHHWLFRVAAKLQASDWKPEKIRAGLLAICTDRGWGDRSGKTLDDIMDKLAKGGPADAAARNPYAVAWPEPNDSLRRLRHSFPPIFDPDEGTDLAPADVLPVLFPGDPLVCVGWAVNRATTLPLSALLPNAAKAPFIVANPMTAEAGPTGSARSLANASPRWARKYLVVEFDTGESRAEQAAVLSSLHTPEAPLVLAVWSGGKSIHGWFAVPGPADALALFSLAALLGADESLFDMSKLVRMPGGTRDNGQRQTILHFNPERIAR